MNHGLRLANSISRIVHACLLGLLFSLLAFAGDKDGIWELYLDDRSVQTYITGPTSGRLGLFAKSGPVEFSELKAWTMTPLEK